MITIVSALILLLTGAFGTIAIEMVIWPEKFLRKTKVVA